MLNVLKKWRDNYVIGHANKIKIPSFERSSIVRRNIIFSGKVQKVGFRLELFCIAQRLNLIGWVKNLEDGSVEAEVQGEENKINFLIHCMKSLKRAKVTNVKIKELEINHEENDFRIIK